MDACSYPATELKNHVMAASIASQQTPAEGFVRAMDQLVLSPGPSLAQLKPRSYLLQGIIGAGTGGNVYRATRERTGQVYAVKIYRKASNSQAFLWNHNHVVQVDSFTNSFKEPALVMEYVGLGDLRQHVWSFDATDTTTILKQVFGACSYLHSFNLVHLDIKPSNILVKSKSPVHVKLADMDGVKRPSQARVHGGFTSLYAAPEVLLGEPFDTRADIWSLGIMTLELMVLNGLPVQGLAETWPSTIRSNLRFLGNGVVHHFMSSLLAIKPQRRPSAQKGLEHRFWDLGTAVYDEMRPSQLWKAPPVDDDLIDTAPVGDAEPFTSVPERHRKLGCRKRVKGCASTGKVQKR